MICARNAKRLAGKIHSFDFELSMNVIGTLGRDFCGSTLFDRLMSSFIGVGAAGEVHWVYDADRVSGTRSNAGWTIRHTCARCGDGCPVFTKDLLDVANRKVIYEMIASSMGVQTLVVSEKWPWHYEGFVSPGELFGVVLFKSLPAAYASDFRNEGQSVAGSMDGYAMVYEKILRWGPSFCKDLVFLRYEDLATRPLEMCKKVFSNFGMSYEIESFFGDISSRYHPIGGNPGSHKKREVVLDERWKCEIEPRIVDKIQAHERASLVYSEMEMKKL